MEDHAKSHFVHPFWEPQLKSKFANYWPLHYAALRKALLDSESAITIDLTEQSELTKFELKGRAVTATIGIKSSEISTNWSNSTKITNLL